MSISLPAKGGTPAGDRATRAFRIGITAEWLGEDVGGLERYSVNLIRGLLRIDDRNRYDIFVSPRGRRTVADSAGPRVSVHATASNSRWYNLPIGLPWAVRQHPVDVLHATFALVPWCPTKQIVLTVHDVGPDATPQFFPKGVRRRFRWLMMRGIARAARIIVPSSATKQELLAHYTLPAEKITVIPEGVSARLASVTLAPTALAAVDGPLQVAGRTLAADYVLYVGRFHARKNLERLVRAFARVKARRRRPTTLVMVGRDMMGDRQRVLDTISALGLQDDVLCPGHVSDAMLDQLYRRAQVFVFPSLHEGFGLPPLEAMAQGLPVVASNVSAMPEVLGDAALLVDSSDTDALADAVERVLDDASLAQRLRTRGKEWVKRYTWEATAAATLALYRELAADIVN